MRRTHKAVNQFILQTIKNFKIMQNKFKKIWLLLAVLVISLCSCNVTRTITNESQYYQKGDTSVVIQTKTIETYDATKKL